MPADQPTMMSIIVSACRKLNLIGALESTPPAEMTENALNEANEILEMIQTRKGYSFFQRKQEFVFTTSKAEYTIGRAADSPDFVLDAGARPVKLEYARLVFTDTTPSTYIPLAIIPVEVNQTIPQPALSSTFPNVIYYKATWPNGTIVPWPAFPTQTSYSLELTWWNQIDTVSMDEINDTMIMPMGSRRFLALTLAKALSLLYPARTNIDLLLQEQRIAEAAFLAPNNPPKVISSTDGIEQQGGFFDYRSRTFN